MGVVWLSRASKRLGNRPEGIIERRVLDDLPVIFQFVVYLHTELGFLVGDFLRGERLIPQAGNGKESKAEVPSRIAVWGILMSTSSVSYCVCWLLREMAAVSPRPSASGTRLRRSALF